MTPLKLLIAGVDRTAWLANGYSIDIEKVLSTETFHLAILDLDSTAGAYRPSVGDDILLTRTDELGDDIELLFGGEIANVIDEPIVDDLGTVTRIRCRDRMVLADQVFLPPRTYAAAPAREVFTAIVEEYLGPKGVTVISDPTGGPALPELRIADPVTTIRQVLDRITLQCGWPWRINGEKAAALDNPGDLPGPATLSDDGQSVLTDPPLRWEKQVLTQATRVFMQTAAPESGPGPVEYIEDTTPASGTAVVPVHVLPTEIRGSTTTDAVLGATSLDVDSLPKDASIRIGARFSVDGQTEIYELTGATTTDADGAATVAFSDGLVADVPEGTAVTFLPGAFVQLELDGVVTPMDGTYVWEPIENAIVYPGGDLGGVEVRYRTWVMHPTFVREWDAVAQDAVGWFDYAAVIDQRITEEEGHTDLPGARAFASAELAKRLTPPKRVTCTTRIPGHYPLLLVPMNFPDRQVVGNYLVTETRIRHSTIDENGDQQPLFYELVLWEGDSLGESWVQHFRGRNPSQGIRWGAVPPVTQMQWTTNRQFVEPAAGQGLAVTPSGGFYTDSAYVELVASTAEAWVLTGAVVTDLYAYFFSGTLGHFALDIAVGAAASEVVIATVRGSNLGQGTGRGIMQIPIPVAAIPAGSRIALRMRKYGTDTTPWRFAITYYKAPIVGNLQTTTSALKFEPNGAHIDVNANATPWANGTWTTIIASAAADLTIAGVQLPGSSASRDWEIDIGVGAAASEVVIATLKGYSNAGGLADGVNWYPFPTPLDIVPAGERVSARFRKSDTGSGCPIALAYYENPL